MNKIVNKFLLAGDMLKDSKIQRFNGFKLYLQNELDKACFAHDAAYSDSKDLAKGTNLDKILINRAYEIAVNPKYDGYQRGLASMMYKFFYKKIRSGANVNEVLAQ